MSRSRVMRRRTMVLRAWMRIEGAKSQKEKGGRDRSGSIAWRRRQTETYRPKTEDSASHIFSAACSWFIEHITRSSGQKPQNGHLSTLKCGEGNFRVAGRARSALA